MWYVPHDTSHKYCEIAQPPIVVPSFWHCRVACTKSQPNAQSAKSFSTLPEAAVPAWVKWCVKTQYRANQGNKGEDSRGWMQTSWDGVNTQENKQGADNKVRRQERYSTCYTVQTCTDYSYLDRFWQEQASHRCSKRFQCNNGPLTIDVQRFCQCLLHHKHQVSRHQSTTTPQRPRLETRTVPLEMQWNENQIANHQSSPPATARRRSWRV